ncbi:hypothetical protein BDP27DRAFT_1286475 [Rhodocollybia butyracea]|uniref:J domain-containing protein n=1 Tax=Rhodocollybia butyracea TaxID=206335 RepID=A0A9P5PYX9_9AGAR|nr:hypothetical protein BDP27DRAFT_1286475 [Rhodocollybia butyracea]
MSRTALANAYRVLGLDEGVSLDVIKNTYKQLALRTHPDKNPDNPDATAEFQRVGEAYNLLSKHLDPSRGPRRSSFSPFEHDHDGDYSEDEFEYGVNYDDELEFYLFIFEHVMRGHARRAHSGRGPRGGDLPPGFIFMPSPPTSFRPSPPREEPRETPQEQAERLRRTREEQEAAELRRKREAAVRKELKEQDRQKEREAAEQRQKAKSGQKKAKANAQRQQAEDAARAHREKVQEKRSAVFQAARAGNAQEVKKGVWENNVDAAGGEVKHGHEEFVKNTPKDPQETLLHIAAQQGDADLVSWLDNHSAEVDERDSKGRTAFHVAVQHGHPNILAYFFDNYNPKDSDHSQIYTAPKSKNVLSFSLQSHEPQVVFMVLESGLATSRDINDAWSWINSPEGRKSMTQQYSKGVPGDVAEKLSDIVQLLMCYGGFTPPPTPTTNRKEGPAHERAFESPSPPSPFSHQEKVQPSGSRQSSNRGRNVGRGRGNRKNRA